MVFGDLMCAEECSAVVGQVVGLERRRGAILLARIKGVERHWLIHTFGGAFALASLKLAAAE